MEKGLYKRYSDFAAWDLDKNSRKYINQSSKFARRLKKKLRKQSRKIIARENFVGGY